MPIRFAVNSVATLCAQSNQEYSDLKYLIPEHGVNLLDATAENTITPPLYKLPRQAI